MAACYFLPLVGGYLADHYFGKYRTIVAFSLPYIIGQMILGIENKPFLFIALSLLAMGSGVIKPNISTLMGLSYDQQRPGQQQASQRRLRHFLRLDQHRGGDFLVRHALVAQPIQLSNGLPFRGGIDGHGVRDLRFRQAILCRRDRRADRRQPGRSPPAARRVAADFRPVCRGDLLLEHLRPIGHHLDPLRLRPHQPQFLRRLAHPRPDPRAQSDPDPHSLAADHHVVASAGPAPVCNYGPPTRCSSASCSPQ